MPKLVLDIQALKANIMSVFTGSAVAMVTNFAMKITTNSSPVARHLFDTNIVGSLDKQR